MYIWVIRDTLVARPGDRLSSKLASLMSKLGIKPIEAGISVNLAVAEGLLLHDNDLRINLLDYTNGLAKCLSESFALAAETGYVTPENIESLLMKAQQKFYSIGRGVWVFN